MSDLLNIGRDILAVVWGLNCLLLVLATLFAIVCVPIFKNPDDYKGFVRRVFDPAIKAEKYFVIAAMTILTALIILRVLIYLGW